MKRKARIKSVKQPRRLELVGDGPLGPVYKNEAGGYHIGDPQATKRRPQSGADIWLQVPGRPPGGRLPVEGGTADDYIDPNAERELVLAVDADAYRLHRAQQQQGIQNSKTTRAKKSREERLAIDKIKAESDERLSDKAASRIYLRKHDPDWKKTSEEDRDKKVNAMAQRVSNQRRKDRLENKE